MNVKSQIYNVKSQIYNVKSFFLSLLELVTIFFLVIFIYLSYFIWRLLHWR